MTKNTEEPHLAYVYDDGKKSIWSDLKQRMDKHRHEHTTPKQERNMKIEQRRWLYLPNMDRYRGNM